MEPNKHIYIAAIKKTDNERGALLHTGLPACSEMEVDSFKRLDILVSSYQENNILLRFNQQFRSWPIFYVHI